MPKVLQKKWPCHGRWACFWGHVWLGGGRHLTPDTVIRFWCFGFFSLVIRVRVLTGWVGSLKSQGKSFVPLVSHSHVHTYYTKIKHHRKYWTIVKKRSTKTNIQQLLSYISAVSERKTGHLFPLRFDVFSMPFSIVWPLSSPTASSCRH